MQARQNYEPYACPLASGTGKWREGRGSACMNAANLENTSSESDVEGRGGGGKWARTKDERKWRRTYVVASRRPTKRQARRQPQSGKSNWKRQFIGKKYIYIYFIY